MYDVTDILDQVEVLHAALVENLRMHSRASEILAQRGLDVETAAELGLGYVPEGEDDPVGDLCRALKLDPVALYHAGILSIDRRKLRGRKDFDTDRIHDTIVAQPELFSRNPEWFQSAAATHTLECGPYTRDGFIVIPFETRDKDGRIRVSTWECRTTYSPAEDKDRYRSPPRRTDERLWSMESATFGLESGMEQYQQSGELVVVEGGFDRIAVLQGLAHLPAKARPGVVGLKNANVGGRIHVEPDSPGWERTGRSENAFGSLLERPGRVTLFLDADEGGRGHLLGNALRFASLGADVGVARTLDGYPPGEGKEESDPSDLYRDRGLPGVVTALAKGRRRTPADLRAKEVADIRRRWMNDERENLRIQIPLYQSLARYVMCAPNKPSKEELTRIAGRAGLDEKALIAEVAAQLNPVIPR